MTDPLGPSAFRTPCMDTIHEHIQRASQGLRRYSQHADTWRSPQKPEERALRDQIRGWARALDALPEQINLEYGRFLKAQGLALRAWVSYDMPMGRFSPHRLLEMIEAVGRAAGIDWVELEKYESE